MIVDLLFHQGRELGSSGASLLSEALKVNSSLTQLDLDMSLWFETVIVHHHITFHKEQYW